MLVAASLLHCRGHQLWLKCWDSFVWATAGTRCGSCSLRLLAGALQNQELQQDVQEAEHQVPGMEKRQSLGWSGHGRQSSAQGRTFQCSREERNNIGFPGEMFSGVAQLFFTSPKPVGVEAAEQHRKHKCIFWSKT